MDRMIYLAMGGAQQAMLAQTVHGNNLANVSTMGFRKDFVQAHAVPVLGDGFATRIFALTENAKTDLTKGTQVSTGRDLDVSVNGDGYIAVQAPDGSEAYTRAGALKIDATGRLLSSNGLPVLGNGGPIALPPFEKVEIGNDGTITIQSLGQAPNALTAADRIKLVKLDEQTVEKDSSGLLHLPDKASAPSDASVHLASGTLETSNVNPMEELVEIVSLARQFEMQIKMMKTAEQNDQASARLLQV
jgi:flagellar basal-body rod protein FlgF